MSSIAGPQLCWCCGAEDLRDGCVRGPRCSCLGRAKCRGCNKCVDHHHRHCTPEFRDRVEEILHHAALEVAHLRRQYEVDLFEYGERKK